MLKSAGKVGATSLSSSHFTFLGLCPKLIGFYLIAGSNFFRNFDTPFQHFSGQSGGSAWLAIRAHRKANSASQCFYEVGDAGIEIDILFLHATYHLLHVAYGARRAGIDTHLAAGTKIIGSKISRLIER